MPAPPGPASCRPGHPWLGRPASCRPADGRRRRRPRPAAEPEIRDATGIAFDAEDLAGDSRRAGRPDPSRPDAMPPARRPARPAATRTASPTSSATIAAAVEAGLVVIEADPRPEKKSEVAARGRAPVKTSTAAHCFGWSRYKDPLTRSDLAGRSLRRLAGIPAPVPSGAGPLQQPARREYASCRQQVPLAMGLAVLAGSGGRRARPPGRSAPE